MTAALRAVRPAPRRLKEMTPSEIGALLGEDPRLIVPAGSCEPHGPHLPLGAPTLIVERLADDLSATFGVLRAPALEYGVSRARAPAGPGDSSVQRKTLHRLLNDLLAGWESAGIREFILLSANDHVLHQEALITVVTRGARVRAADVWAIPMRDLLTSDPGPLPGGEVETSLLLHLAPAMVRLELASDRPLIAGEFRRYRLGRLRVPEGSTGSLGCPRAATAATGQALYERLLDRISRRLFLTPAQDA
jgi:creatinine amidohydrolase/Fe(II)-dependent formamide hydrolase-like protein